MFEMPLPWWVIVCRQVSQVWMILDPMNDILSGCTAFLIIFIHIGGLSIYETVDHRSAKQFVDQIGLTFRACPPKTLTKLP